MQKHARFCTWPRKQCPLCVKIHAIKLRNKPRCIMLEESKECDHGFLLLLGNRGPSMTHEPLQVLYVSRLKCMTQSWFTLDVSSLTALLHRVAIIEYRSATQVSHAITYHTCLLIFSDNTNVFFFVDIRKMDIEEMFPWIRELWNKSRCICCNLNFLNKKTIAWKLLSFST